MSLYPLSLDRVLQLTFSLFRFRWAALIGVSAAIMLPVLLIIALLQAAVGEDLARLQQAQLDLAAGLPVSFEDALPLPAILVSYLALVLMGIAGYLALAAVIHLTAGTYAGRRVSARDALGAALGRLATLLGIAVVVMLAIFGVMLLGGVIGVGLIVASVSGGQVQPGFAVFAGLIALVATVVAVVFLSVRWAFPVQAAMLEQTPALASLGRSWRLVSGSSWRVLGYTLVFGLLIGLIALVLDTVVALALGSGFEIVDGRVTFAPGTYVAASLVNGLVAVLLAPITTIGLTMLYFDLRWRRGEPPLAGSVAQQQGQPGV